MKVLMTAFFLVATSILSTNVLACDIEGKTGFLPENDLRIPVNSKMANNMTQVRFDKIISTIESIYGPKLESMGKKLIIHRKWKTNQVNAKAYQSGSNWHVEMYGGLARHRKNTPDGFTIVLCHELGHHLGGSPRKGSSWWASNEGQSDYWATLKCFRKFAENDDNQAIISRMNIPTMVKKECENSFQTENEIAICQRASMGGLALGQVLKDLRKGKVAIRFSTPDNKIVSRTYDGHPAAQCRLDTYYMGSVCSISDDVKVSSTDANIGTCNRVDGYKKGLRPLCWFRPKK